MAKERLNFLSANINSEGFCGRESCCPFSTHHPTQLVVLSKSGLRCCFLVSHLLSCSQQASQPSQLSPSFFIHRSVVVSRGRKIIIPRLFPRIHNTTPTGIFLSCLSCRPPPRSRIVANSTQQPKIRITWLIDSPRPSRIFTRSRQ